MLLESWKAATVPPIFTTLNNRFRSDETSLSLGLPRFATALSLYLHFVTMSNEQPQNTQGTGLHHLHTGGHVTYNMTGVSRSTPAEELYPYKPLNFDTHEIRLLRLYLQTNNEQTIFCCLENVSLIDAKPYFALSYC
jgi:hypothetical protein